MAKSRQQLTEQLDLAERLGPRAQRRTDDITINKPVIREFFRVMLEAYAKRTGRFQFIHHTTDGPQHKYVPGQDNGSFAQHDMFDKRNRPPKMVVGSRTFLAYYYLVVPTDRLQDSDKLYLNHTRLYADHPWIYSGKVLETTKERLAQLFKDYSIGIHNENARFFLNNALTLYRDFDGNPVEIFRTCGSTVEGVLAWRNNYEKEQGRNPLLGFEHKIASLYLLYLAEFGALPFPRDAFAVDVHIIFQLYQVGGFTLHKRMDNSVIARILRETICDICEEEQFDKISLANVLWLNGSKGCNRCSSNTAAELLCPAWNMCSGRYATDNYHHNGSIDPADPLFPKGGVRPKYGIQRVIRRRPEVKGRGPILIEQRATLFDAEFAEQEGCKVIPIASARKGS